MGPDTIPGQNRRHVSGNGILRHTAVCGGSYPLSDVHNPGKCSATREKYKIAIPAVVCLYPFHKIFYHLAGQIASFFLSVPNFAPSFILIHLQNLISLPFYFSGSPPAAAVSPSLLQIEFLNGCHGIRRIGNSRVSAARLKL